MAVTDRYTIRVGVVGDAQLQKFQRNVDRLNRSAKATAVSTQRMGNSLSNLGRIAGLAGFAIGSMFSAQTLKRSLDFADAVQKSSNQLGLSAEKLQSYRFALEQSGGSAAGFDKALKTFSKNLGDAARGTGLLKTLVDDLGISLKDSNGQLKGTEELLKDFGNAIAAAESPAEKLSIAMNAFGRSGAAFVTLFENGAVSLEEFEAAASDLGLVLSQELADQAANVNDRLNILATQGRVMISSFIIPLSDRLVTLGENFRSMVKAIGESETALSLFKGVAISVGIVLATMFPIAAVAAGVVAIIAYWEDIGVFLEHAPKVWFAEAVAGWTLFMANLKNVVARGMRSLVQAAAVGLAQFVDTINPIANAINLAPDSWIPEQVKAFTTLKGATQEIIDKYNEVNPPDIGFDDETTASILTTAQNALTLRNNWNEAREALSGGAGAAADAAAEIENLNDVIETGGTGGGGGGAAVVDRFKLFTDELKGFRDPAIVAQEKIAALQAAFAEFGDALNPQQLEDYKRALAELGGESQNVFSDIATSIGDGLGNALDAVIQGTKSAKDAFRDFARDVLSQIGKIAAKLITSKVLQFLGLPGVGGGFSFSAQGNVFQGGNIIPFARGGIVTGPTVFPMARGMGLMGEAGAEAVVPLSRNSSGDLGVGQAPVNVIVNNNASGTRASAKQGEDGSVYVTIEEVRNIVANDLAAGGNNIATSLERTYKMSRGR